MTKEESIKQLEWYFEKDNGISADLVTKQAFNIIKALSHEPSRDMEEIAEIMKSDADAETKCKMISNILTAKPHYFKEQKPTDRIEYGTDGNAYKLWISNSVEKNPCEDCKYNHTSICGNCNAYDEFEEIDFVQEHKKIPVTLDLTPCDDAVSRKAVEEITWEEPSYTDALNVLTEVRDKVKALPSVTQKSDEKLYKNGFSDGYEQGYKDAEPKTGHWILDETDNSITCDKCGCRIWANDISNGDAHYCPNCGFRMDEPQESEDKE